MTNDKKRENESIEDDLDDDKAWSSEPDHLLWSEWGRMTLAKTLKKERVEHAYEIQLLRGYIETLEGRNKGMRGYIETLEGRNKGRPNFLRDYFMPVFTAAAAGFALGLSVSDYLHLQHEMEKPKVEYELQERDLNSNGKQLYEKNLEDSLK